MAPPRRFIPGEKFGRLTIIREVLGDTPRRVVCLCDCGIKVVRVYKNIRRGLTRSCGCLRSEYVARKNTKHGAGKRLNRTPEYIAWKRMRQRCNDRNTHEWDNYGGRGIQVDIRWDDFATFLMDVSHKPSPRHSLDRIDNDGDYTPANVRWATPREQCRNKRNNRVVSYNDRLMTLVDLSEECSIPYNTLLSRLNRDWSVEQAVSTPLRRRSRSE